MKNLTSSFIILTLLISTFWACSKKEDPAPEPTPTATKTSMLINKKWGMSAFKVSPAFVYKVPDFGIEINITDLYDPTYSANPLFAPILNAIKDDTISFTATSNNAMEGSFTTQVNKTYSTEKDGSGTWKANADFTELTLDDKINNITLVFKILELKEKSMNIETIRKNPIDLTDTKDYKATITFNTK